jgi:hypothetical protein
MTSKETAADILAQTEALAKDLVDWVEKGKKASAKRARKATLDLEKTFKVFRKQSVIDSK